MSSSESVSVFDSIGEVGIRQMVNEFYKQIPSDKILGPMYPSTELAAAERRLADFLIYRFGGPDVYIRERGHPQLRMRHVQFAISIDVRNRWVALMDVAIERAFIPEKPAQAIHNFLHEAATFLINCER